MENQQTPPDSGEHTVADGRTDGCGWVAAHVYPHVGRLRKVLETVSRQRTWVGPETMRGWDAWESGAAYARGWALCVGVWGAYAPPAQRFRKL